VKCATPLPWEDVDRVTGCCRSCGTPFDFSVPADVAIAAVPRSPPAIEAAPEIAPELALATELALPATRVPRPSGVSVAQPGPIEITWRTIGVREMVTIGGAIFADAMFVFGVAVLKEKTVSLMFGLVGALFSFAAIRSLGSRARVVANDAAILVQQRSVAGPRSASAPIAQIARFMCEESVIVVGTVDSGSGENRLMRRVCHVYAILHDESRVRLVTDLENREIAIFVTQTLQDRLATPRT
jgi:hypothetical protein